MEPVKKYTQFFESVTDKDLTALHDQIHEAEKTLQDAKEEAEKYVKQLNDSKSMKHKMIQAVVYRMKDAVENCQLAKQNIKKIDK